MKLKTDFIEKNEKSGTSRSSNRFLSSSSTFNWFVILFFCFLFVFIFFVFFLFLFFCFLFIYFFDTSVILMSSSSSRIKKINKLNIKKIKKNKNKINRFFYCGSINESSSSRINQ